MDEITPAFFTLKQAEKYSGLRKWRLRQAIRDGELKSVKPFGTRLISKAEIDRILGVGYGEKSDKRTLPNSVATSGNHQLISGSLSDIKAETP